MPIHLAEHYVAGKDHHLGGRFSFVGDRQPVARLVQAQAGDESPAIEMPAVRNAGVQAVAHQIIDFVDVDRPGKHTAKNPLRAVVGPAGDQRCDGVRIEIPVVGQHVGDFAANDEPPREVFVTWKLRKAQIFDRVAERPVADVVKKRGSEQQLGILWHDRRRESVVAGKPVQILDCSQEYTQRMLLPRMVRGRIHETHKPQLADLRQAAKRGRVDKPPHARCQWHVDAGRNPHDAASVAPSAHFRDIVDRIHGGPMLDSRASMLDGIVTSIGLNALPAFADRRLRPGPKPGKYGQICDEAKQSGNCEIHCGVEKRAARFQVKCDVCRECTDAQHDGRPGQQAEILPDPL